MGRRPHYPEVRNRGVLGRGIGYRIAAWLPAALAKSGRLQPPRYTVVEANKSGELVYEAGREAYGLTSPEGERFVMQSSNVEPHEWGRLAENLDTPAGWQAGIETPRDDLVVPLGGHVRVVMDDLGNVYNSAPAS